MTAEEYKSIDEIFEDWAYSTNSDRMVCLRLIKEFVEKQLSEHSTKEPVAWLCEHENCRPEITTYKDIADNYMKYGYTITPLVKK